MTLNQYNRTLWFYTMALILPWLFWFGAAYLSRLPDPSHTIKMAEGLLGMLGLVAPVLVAAYLFTQDSTLMDDLKKRFFLLSGFPRIYLFYALFLIFLTMVIAQFLSLGLGHGMDQFVVSGSPTFTSALFSPWFILLFAPIVEELAWHTYGTDTLRRRFSLFWTSIIFAIYWVLWHLPLSMIQGYYHSNVVEEGWIYSVNFAFSLFVFVILMNWLYYKTNRSVLIVVIFHLSANISNEMFATHPDSKVIQTVLLLIISVVVLIHERKMFFGRPDTDSSL